MKITSIDNVYEDDGLTNLYTFLSMLNKQKPDDLSNDVLIAILPEYNNGRLDRLDCITMVAGGEATCTPDEGDLQGLAWRMANDARNARADAMAKLEAPIVVEKGTT